MAGGVIEEAARQGLPLTTLDDALARAEPVPAPADLAASSWGEGGDLRTWSGPEVADLAWQARRAELALLGPGSRPPIGRCASCWRCRAATGPSSPTAGPPGTTRASGRAGTPTALVAGAGRERAGRSD